jgi:hypothetical protein
MMEETGLRMLIADCAADRRYARKQSTTVTKLLQAVFRYCGPVIAPDPDRIV